MNESNLKYEVLLLWGSSFMAEFSFESFPFQHLVHGECLVLYVY
jgi:hypothetical protein